MKEKSIPPGMPHRPLGLTLLCIVLAGLVSPSVHAQVGPVVESVGNGVRTLVLSHSTRELDVVLEFPPVLLDTVLVGESAFHIPRQGGWFLQEEPGVPLNLGRTFNLALPPNGEHEVRWLVEEEFVHTDLHLPVTMRLASGDSYASEGVRAPGDLGRSVETGGGSWERWAGSTWPEEVIQVGDPSWARFQRVLPIGVRRLRVERSGEVRELRRLRITARFAEASAADAGRVPVGWEDAASRIGVLNPVEAKAWLAAPRPRRSFGETHIFDSTPNPWLKVRTSRRGIYRLTYNDLSAAGYPVDEIDLESVRMFAGSQLAVPESVRAGDLPLRMEECAILVEDGGETGVWDPDDSVVFLGNGPDGWLSDHASENRGFERHVRHPSAPHGVYWLTWGGSFQEDPKRMQVVSVDAGGLQPRTTGETRMHIERDTFYDPRPKADGVTWEKFLFQEAVHDEDNVEFQVLFDAKGVVQGEPALVRARYWGASWHALGSIPDHILVGRLNGVLVDSVAWDALDHMDIQRSVVALGEGQNRWHYVPLYTEDPTNPNRIDRIYLAWIEVNYPRRLEAVSDSLEFFGPGGESPLVFKVSGFSTSSLPVVMNATDPWNPYILEGVVEDDGSGQSVTFADEPDQVFDPHYAVLDLSRAGRPAGVEVVQRQGRWLRDRQDVVDAIIITHPSLLGAAEELASYRRDHYPDRPAGIVEIVTTEEIYDEFSWGLVDVVSIRNFLEHAYHRWVDEGTPGRRPAYVIFFGDPYYDERNYLREGGVLLVPNYQNHYARGLRFSIYNPQFTSDDWMTLIDGDDPLIDFSWGRFPVENESQARDLVQKTIRYEQNPPLTWWKTRFADLADDFCQGSTVEGLARTHTNQAEEIIDNALSPYIHPDRLYLVEYGTTCPTPTKPQATEDLIDLINDGVFAVNYTGHGSEGQLSDEKLFETSRVQSLANAGKPFIFVNASCSVGKHDLPGVGLGEAMLRMKEGGAISVFAASSLASSYANAELNRLFFRKLMPNRRPAAIIPTGLGVRQAKNDDYGANNRRYVLLGDPLSHLAFPRHEVKLELDGGLGVGADADTLLRGARTRIEGTIQDTLGNILTDFDGDVSLRIYDSERKREPCANDTGPCVNYELLGAPMYRGTVPVTAGRFTLDFVIPKSLLLGDRGDAKIFAYAQDGSRDAMGCRAELWIPEDVVVANPDTEGPEITLQLASGDSLAQPGDELHVTMTDSSGINITGLRGSLSVVLRYNDRLGRPILVEDLASRVVFVEGASMAEVTVKVPATLPTGTTYTVEVTAADNLNNQSRASIVMRLMSPGDAALNLGRVFNFPNPTEGATSFFFEINREVDVQISIYTATGRRIQRLDWSGRDPQEAWQGGLPWDGRDADGDFLSNGVYFFKLRVRDPESGEVITRTERLAVLR